MKSRVLATSSALALGLVAAGAFAGQALAQDEEEPAADAQERIVVTGSRIVRQDFTANSPIVTVDPEQFENTTSLTVEGVLNRLPQFMPDGRSEFRTTSVEPTPDQTPGTGQVNLRGLGANRTLVLIDGRRAMPTNASMSVDTNAIPSTAIQRVEIISGGASAVYGADAIAGVVNFILRDNYEGAEISARYGVTERGDAENTQISGLFGADVDGGRGNVMFGADLSTRSPAVFADRDWALENFDNPNVLGVGGFLTSSPNETFWQPNLRPPGVSPVGPSNTPSQTAVNTMFAGRPPGTTVNNSSWRFYINDDPNGQGTLYTTTNAFLANQAAGSYRYNGPTRLDGYGDCPFRDFKQDGTLLEYACYQELAGPLDRYSFFGRGRYEINEAVEASLRGNYSTTSTRSVLNPAAATFIVPVGTEIWTGNAYSPSSLRSDGSTHPDYLPGGRYGLNCPTMGGCTQSQAFPLPPDLVTLLNSRSTPALRNEDIQLNSFLTWGDVRGSSTQTDVYQLELAFEGDLGVVFPWAEDWFWDVGLSHGETHILNLFNGFGSQQRFRAVVGSPNFGVNFAAQGNPLFGGAGGGTATCNTGLPVVRDFDPSEDCIKAYEVEMQNSSRLDQNTFEANLTGGLFDLPAGQLQFAAGVAYREDSFKFNTDTVNDLANFTDEPLGLFPKENSDGYISVQELYGELLIPVLTDLPLIQSLSFELGGRLSDQDPTGEVETMKFLGDWEINSAMRLRGGWNLASRSPNLQELFSARQQSVAFGFGTAVGDPCSRNNQSPALDSDGVTRVSANVAWSGAAQAAHAQAICTLLMQRDSVAAGLPAATGSGVFYGRPLADHPAAQGPGVPGGNWTSVVTGNEAVEPETANTYTVGLVVTSPFENAWLAGFTGSVDYYKIRLTDVIAITDTSTLIADCMGLLNNPTQDTTRFSCTRLIRDPVDGDGLFMDRTYTNTGRAWFSGVDLQVNWRAEFEDLGLSMIPGGASVNLVASFPIEQITQASSSQPKVDAVGTQYIGLNIGGGAFEYDTLTTVNYFVGDFNASLGWQHTPAIEAAEYATNPATTARGVLKPADLFNLSAGYRLNDVVMLRAGVDNLFDKEPPLTGGNPNDPRFVGGLAPYRSIGGFGGSGAGAGAYDQLGRRYFVGVTMTY